MFGKKQWKPKKCIKKGNKTITISILKPIPAGLTKENFIQTLEENIYSELIISDEFFKDKNSIKICNALKEIHPLEKLSDRLSLFEVIKYGAVDQGSLTVYDLNGLDLDDKFRFDPVCKFTLASALAFV